MNKYLTSEEKLFSKINHDLRGSFVSILGYSGILTDPIEEVTESEIKEFVSIIDFRSKETFELFESFTNWLKLERYSNSLNQEKIYLYENVISVYSLLQNEFETKNIQVNFDFDETILVLFDIQIINSLLKNIFSFINKSIKEKSELKISTLKTKSYPSLKFEFNSLLSENEITPLRKLNENEIEYANVPNEILLSKKFIELCEGNFNFEVMNGGRINLIIDFGK